MKTHPDFTYEEPYWQQDYVVIGIDEVGRGCLAGPVTVGGVCIDATKSNIGNWLNQGINDSKQLTSKKRAELSRYITTHAFYSLSFIDVDDINTVGIVKSILMGITEVVQKLKKSLSNKKIILLVDGAPISHIPYINSIPRISVIKGDGKSISIAAASLVAKVERDLVMTRLALTHPEYNWEKNKGYGTLKHRQAIQQCGPSAFHRTLFLRKILRNNL